MSVDLIKISEELVAGAIDALNTPIEDPIHRLRQIGIAIKHLKASELSLQAFLGEY